MLGCLSHSIAWSRVEEEGGRTENEFHVRTRMDPCVFSSVLLGRCTGGGNTIRGLKVNGDSFLGLFGKLGRGAVVEKLALVDCRIDGRGIDARWGYFTGAIAAVSDRALIRYVYATGELFSTSLGDGGGLVGDLSGGVLHDSFSRVKTWGSWSAGGIAGRIDENGQIIRCYATSSLSPMRVGTFPRSGRCRMRQAVSTGIRFFGGRPTTRTTPCRAAAPCSILSGSRAEPILRHSGRTRITGTTRSRFKRISICPD